MYCLRGGSRYTPTIAMITLLVPCNGDGIYRGLFLGIWNEGEEAGG